jgi:3-deoxy-manno-octulosonate cytidylyltransferase (CMP-KDO synthetase)
MILWVTERALGARNVARAIVATDDRRILDAVQSAGHEALMTRSDHASGTDRVAEVVLSLEAADIIVNIQADEPMISRDTIDGAIEALATEGRMNAETRRRGDTGTGAPGDSHIGRRGGSEIDIVTTWEPLESVADVLNPDIVKMVLDDDEQALYFSRAPVPYPRDAVRKHGTMEKALENEPTLLVQFRKHTGLYVYRRHSLLQFASWPQSRLERVEKLEQLRALEHNMKIKAIRASKPSIGVDTIADLERVRGLIEREGLEL